MALRTVDEASWFTIQEVARRSGLSEATLRYYERIGLLSTVPRDASSGHRRYDAATVETIESLACLRAAGMRVEDMRHYLQLLARGDEAAGEQRQLFARHATRLATQIAQLQLRLEYLQLKAQLWDARDRGDSDAELRTITQLLNVIEQFSRPEER
jgi:DNA-binding transcriptional MerR regulator